MLAPVTPVWRIAGEGGIGGLVYEESAAECAGTGVYVGVGGGSVTCGAVYPNINPLN